MTDGPNTADPARNSIAAVEITELRTALSEPIEPSTVVCDFSGDSCILCSKAFEDGSASRATRGYVRVKTTVGWFRGAACSPCITELASMALPIFGEDGQFEQLQPSDNPAFKPFSDFGSAVKEYIESDAYKERQALNEILRRPIKDADGNVVEQADDEDTEGDAW